MAVLKDFTILASHHHRRLPVLPGLLILLLTAPALAVTLQPFQGEYQLSRNGGVLGRATLSLSRDQHGDYTYRNRSRGDNGLAALLRLKVDETSHFQWTGTKAHDLGYQYQLRSLFKTTQRLIRFDWNKHLVQVNESGRIQKFPTRPGVVDRNLSVLLLGYAVATGRRGEMTIPVAMHDRVSMQRYRISPSTQRISTPAGSFNAYEVQRSNADNGIRAWFTPPLLVPVRMIQHTGKNATVELQLLRRP